MKNNDVYVSEEIESEDKMESDKLPKWTRLTADDFKVLCMSFYFAKYHGLFSEHKIWYEDVKKLFDDFDDVDIPLLTDKLKIISEKLFGLYRSVQLNNWVEDSKELWFKD